MKKIIMLIVTFALLFIPLSCIHDDDYQSPILNYPNLTTNYTIPQLKAEATENSTLLHKDSIIEGFVVSSDEGGNIYKNLYITTSDGKSGIQLNINQSNIYNYYPAGRKVYVKLKGLYLAKQYDIAQLGGEKYGSSTVGQAEWNLVKNMILLAEDKVNEETLVQHYTNIENAIKNENLATLIELDSVQFQEKYLNKTYYDSDNTSGSYIEDKQGNILNVRVSSYAKFANNILPSGSGRIKGILTKYKSTWQLMLRTIQDVNLDQSRWNKEEEKGDTEGTKENPFTISQAMNNQGQTGKWVKGYIVGSVTGQSIVEGAQFNAPFTTQSNILIAASPNETDYTKCIPVQLPYDATGVNTVRPNLNLATNPVNFKREVMVYGDLTTYFNQAGMKNTSDYVLGKEDNSSNTLPEDGEENSQTTNTLVFPGGDFEDYNAFISSLNSFGIKPYANLSNQTGINNSNSLHLKTDGTSANEYVFTILAQKKLLQQPKKIQFYIKGKSNKTISISLFKTDQISYYAFNLGDVSEDKVITASSNNSYSGIIDTNGQWALITLDISGLSDLNLNQPSNNFFGLKVGKLASYNIFMDEFRIY
ncbi:hypothetical protein ETU10_02260 [Apibacter muscae]|uniref:DUF5689 domain-containing protein n=1 Tax=Apibacter muscae TaxID=2509004 RepID=UPI0011AC6E7B|nr:DUF5689 domain-containing protein [Apibacter muscae]TWP24805.1 hypothetical protein ETU10_02260 [Apibacter muscae]